MLINSTTSGTAQILAPQGKIDTITSPEFLEAVKQLPESINNLIIDFEGVSYISSAGLRVLLQSQSIMESKGADMKIINANEIVRDIFSITGFDELLKIEK